MSVYEFRDILIDNDLLNPLSERVNINTSDTRVIQYLNNTSTSTAHGTYITTHEQAQQVSCSALCSKSSSGCPESLPLTRPRNTTNSTRNQSFDRGAHGTRPVTVTETVATLTWPITLNPFQTPRCAGRGVVQFHSPPRPRERYRNISQQGETANRGRRLNGAVFCWCWTAAVSTRPA